MTKPDLSGPDLGLGSLFPPSGHQSSSDKQPPSGNQAPSGPPKLQNQVAWLETDDEPNAVHASSVMPKLGQGIFAISYGTKEEIRNRIVGTNVRFAEPVKLDSVAVGLKEVDMSPTEAVLHISADKAVGNSPTGFDLRLFGASGTILAEAAASYLPIPVGDQNFQSGDMKSDGGGWHASKTFKRPFNKQPMVLCW